jgi:hypothetical protein
MPTQTADLFLVEELDDAGRTSVLAEDQLTALRAVADWIKSYVIQPHRDLGRAGPVCPYVPGALERRKLWLAPERVGEANTSDVVELMTAYRSLFLDTEPADGADADRAAIIVVFTDLPAARAQELFADVLQEIAVRAYAEDGILYGPFYEGHQGSALHNPEFRPFRSPVPFMFVRHGVVGDWPFFLDKEDWLSMYADRFRESAVHALAAELRGQPSRVARD